MYVVMGVDIKKKQDGNDLEFNIIKGTRTVEMHRRKRKYYKTIPGVLIWTTKEASIAVEPESLDTDMSHYHGYIEIPETVEHKGQHYTVTQLEAGLMKQGVDVYGIKIPGTVKSISSSAFLNCWRLEYAQLAEGTVYIEMFAFGGCYKLREIVLPDSVAHLEDYAFVLCPNLESVTIGSGMRRMIAAFECCPNIRKIICRATIPPAVVKHTFDQEVCENAVLRVPAESIPAYRSDPLWNNFKTIEAI